MTATRKKRDFPRKLCLVCNRPFEWRKKWAKVWEEVKYCSDACRKNRNRITEKDCSCDNTACSVRMPISHK
ncbi:MAG: DUF2256 domain-containing protein [Bdellovibrionota bacterium]